MTLRHWPLACLVPALALAACQPAPPARSSLSPVARGEALARSSCAGCHAIGSRGSSPNPKAPPFALVVNQQDLTATTLSAWLRDAHNYPREMDFSVNAREVDDLVAYMLTLRDPAYRPPS